MSDELEALGLRYAAALQRYIEGGEEPARDAYELGRQGMADGLGVLDMAIMHRTALKALETSAPESEKERMVDDAADFFYELLSPFELSFRGFRAANEELRRLNDVLGRQTATLESTKNRELETFSYSVSHDLRAPLRSINAFSQIVLDESGEHLNEEGKRHLRKIREAASAMAQLIDGLLGLSRVTRAELRRVDVDLTGLVQHICERLTMSSPERTCTFKIEEGVRANGDARLMAVIFENLLGNAWKVFTAKRPQAEITFGREAREEVLVYFVRDNGAGFDMTYTNKLFGAFERLHSSREFEGTGIGLATVKRVVERHGGRVWAEGEVGKGATLFFTLA